MKTQLRFIFLVCIITLGSSLDLLGQKSTKTANTNRFEGAIIFGANFAELSGEDVSDFIGVNVGFRGTAKLKDKWRLGLELLFSQQGEYLEVKSYPNVPLQKILINYIEVPLQLDWQVVQKGKKTAWLNFGGAFAKLINHQLIAKDQNDISPLLVWEQESAVLITFGATAFFNDHIGFNFRGAQSLNSLDLSPTLSFRGLFRF